MSFMDPFNGRTLFPSFADSRARGDSAWDRKCVGIESTAALNQLVSTAGAMPKIARLDLAALVVNRQKLLSENVKFGKFHCCFCSMNSSFHCCFCFVTLMLFC